MKLSMLALLGVTLTMMAPPSVAVHGEAYTAYGTAINAAGELLFAEVHWSGYDWTSSCGSGWGCFTVTLTTPDGAVVVQEQVPGFWSANGPVYYFFEILNYQAWAAESGCSATSCPHLLIRGLQGQQVTNGGEQKAIMLYVGNYWDWQLQLVVPYGVIL
ncbi:MAG TPA: hypothetical protein VGR28_15170 [Candidatus Thermoplasmatota archaeon]|jgi:hypothetical protein|nr:hypothetical protein [Candidatus Thermoplasmatota archaeon]